MSKRAIKVESTLKPSPDINLTEKEGAKLIGTLVSRHASTLFEGKFSYLIAVEDVTVPARLYNKETKERIEVGLAPGDKVFLKSSTMLDKMLAQVNDGEKVEITYLGKGKAKKGRRAPYLYDVNVIEN